MKRVEVTRGFVGICHMQVCAESDATDAEILTVCNQQNPSGTSHGWSSVERGTGTAAAPVICGDDPGRTHFLAAC